MELFVPSIVGLQNEMNNITDSIGIRVSRISENSLIQSVGKEIKQSVLQFCWFKSSVIFANVPIFSARTESGQRHIKSTFLLQRVANPEVVCTCSFFHSGFTKFMPLLCQLPNLNSRSRFANIGKFCIELAHFFKVRTELCRPTCYLKTQQHCIAGPVSLILHIAMHTSTFSFLCAQEQHCNLISVLV